MMQNIWQEHIESIERLRNTKSPSDGPEVEINGRVVQLQHVKLLYVIDTAKFKIELKEYEPLEHFVRIFDPAVHQEMMLRITKDKSIELLRLGIHVKLPDRTICKKK